MKILIIADPLDKQYAGIYQYTRGLTEAMGRYLSHHEIIVVRMKEGEVIPGTRTIVVKNLLPFWANDPFRTFVKLPLAIRKLKPDVVIEPAHFGPFNLPKIIKRVTVIHDLVPFNNPRYARFLSTILQRLFIPGVLKRANGIIANSETTRREIIARFPVTEKKIRVISPGADGAFTREEKPEFLKELGIRQPYFLFTGTIEPRKNLNCLLEAYKELCLKESGRIPQLVIAGKTGWKSKSFYKALYNHPNKDNIIITGYLDRKDLPALFSSARSFILPSFTEGFGIPVIEAWSCGIPCILANSGALSETGKDAALFFSPDDSEELSLCMQQMLGDDETFRKYAEAGRQRVATYSWEKSASLLEDMLNNLL